MTHNMFLTSRDHVWDSDPSGDVVEDFVAAARDWPYRTALVHNGTETTYQQLAERVRLIAARCNSRDFGVNRTPNRIGVLVSHTPAAAVSLLGVLLAGATYCPIDAALPAGRIRALVTALDVHGLFAAAPHGHDLPGVQIEILDADCTSTGTELPERRWRRNDGAYVLCTSGSTGTPKPVAVSRHALSVTVRALRDLFALTPEDRVLQFASLGWDTCLEEILPALTTGSALVFDDAAHRGSFPIFLRMLAEQAITVVDLPTAFWHELVLFLHEEHAALPTSVRLVVIGGERVDPTRLRQWRDLGLERVRLLNTYGCTETTMITHAVQLSGPDTEPGVTASDSEVSIGRPLPHVTDHVTGDGELLVSGPGLATGYLGLPEQTATAFPVVDHGAGPARWFHTGDVVSRGEHGLLYSLGRIDEQFKVLGVRIHPAEVEAQLSTHPAVAGSVVVGERVLGGRSLTAYVVTARPTTAAELRSHLRERLPKQFVPTRVRFVPALVYTPSGKVDRAATCRAVVDSSKGADL
ncbi:nonribosomal peptide synthetase protein VioO [Mycobacterium sp. BK558]|nr:nonribosomal peptide synthetase protein VioO [Mycobacterium sp. BK558]